MEGVAISREKVMTPCWEKHGVMVWRIEKLSVANVI
jgi:hypothetical protein